MLLVPASTMLGPSKIQPGKPDDCPSKVHVLQQADSRSSRLSHRPGHRHLTSVPSMSHVPKMLGPLQLQPRTPVDCAQRQSILQQADMWGVHALNAVPGAQLVDLRGACHVSTHCSRHSHSWDRLEVRGVQCQLGKHMHHSRQLQRPWVGWQRLLVRAVMYQLTLHTLQQVGQPCGKTVCRSPSCWMHWMWHSVQQAGQHENFMSKPRPA